MNDWVDAEHHVELAHEHYDAGRWDEAEEELRQALSLNPYQTEWQFNLGLTLEAAGRYESAAEAFMRCSRLHTEHGNGDANSTLLAGVNLIRDGQSGVALRWLDAAEQIEPMNVAIIVHRIEALMNLERFDEAEESFYVGQQIDSEYPELYSVMGETLQRSEHHERAVWCFREAARLDPGLPRVRAQLASAYARLGRLERARQLYIQELRIDPGDPETLLELGELLIDMYRYQEAGEKFRRVLELYPDNAEAHFSLAELAETEGRVADALVHFDVVLRLDKDYVGVRTRLARTLLKRGREEDLPRIRDLLVREQTEVERSIASQDGRIEMKLLTGSSRSTLGSPRGSKPTPGEDGVTTQGVAAEVDDLDDLGRAFVQAGMHGRATRVYTMILGIDPVSYKAFHGLSVSALQAEKYEEGVEAAKKSLELHPSFVPAMHNLVLAYYRQGQYIRARYWLTQALRHEPDDEQLRRLRLRLRVRTVFGVLTWISSRIQRVLRSVRGVLMRPVR